MRLFYWLSLVLGIGLLIFPTCDGGEARHYADSDIKQLVKEIMKDELEDLKAKLEDQVNKLEDLAKIGTLRSCAEYTHYGLKTSGLYLVDPDGILIGHEPFQVFCNFSSGGTEVMHNTESLTEVTHCTDPGCYQKKITYIDGQTQDEIAITQIEALIELSEYCEQSIQYDCIMALLSDDDVNFSFWEDRHGEKNIYFTGSNYGYHVCDCHYQDEGCLEEKIQSNTCNCDATNVPIKLSDTGTITNSTALPVMKLFFGGLKYKMQYGAYQLGRLNCYGEKPVAVGTSCSALKKRGLFKSGYYNIKPIGEFRPSIVFCDMTTAAYTNVPQVEELSDVSPLGTILAWVPKPQLESNTEGWMLCDGSKISKGPWKGGRTPDLNSVGAFLRGGVEDLVLEMEDDQIEDHQHDDSGHSHSCSASSSQASHHHSYVYSSWDDSSGELCDRDSRCQDTDDFQYESKGTNSVSPHVSTSCNIGSKKSGLGGVSSPAKNGRETRPVNMKVIYVIRCW